MTPSTAAPDKVAYCQFCQTVTWHYGLICEWSDMHVARGMAAGDKPATLLFWLNGEERTLRDFWFSLPTALRLRWWRETDYGRAAAPPPDDLVKAMWEALR